MPPRLSSLVAPDSSDVRTARVVSVSEDTGQGGGAIIAPLIPTVETNMTRQDALAFFAARQRLWQAHDADALAGGHSATGVVMSPMFGRRSGRDAIRESYRSLFTMFPDWAFVATDPIIEGARIALPFSATATHVGEFMGSPAPTVASRFRVCD